MKDKWTVQLKFSLYTHGDIESSIRSPWLFFQRPLSQTRSLDDLLGQLQSQMPLLDLRGFWITYLPHD